MSQVPETPDSLQVRPQRAEEVEHVFVAIDVANLWHSTKREFGDKARIDYSRLIEIIRNNQASSKPRELDIVAYTITSVQQILPNGTIKQLGSGNEKFLKYLFKLKCKVKTRHVFEEKGYKKPFSMDWDVGITVDALTNLDEYDTFSLVNGDGDYIVLLEKLKNLGKYVDVYTFKSTTSRILRETAHKVTYLTVNEMFMVERKDVRKSSTESSKSIKT